MCSKGSGKGSSRGSSGSSNSTTLNARPQIGATLNLHGIGKQSRDGFRSLLCAGPVPLGLLLDLFLKPLYPSAPAYALHGFWGIGAKTMGADGEVRGGMRVSACRFLIYLQPFFQHFNCFAVIDVTPGAEGGGGHSAGVTRGTTGDGNQAPEILGGLHVCKRHTLP